MTFEFAEAEKDFQIWDTGPILNYPVPTRPAMTFIISKYTKGEVNRAGDILREDSAGPAEINAALLVINNWRASHSYPLQAIKMLLRGRAKKSDPTAVVSQRLKRLPSIRNKLVRKQTEGMELARMQDIGGCRAVLSDITALEKTAEAFKRSFAKNTDRHQLAGTPKDHVKEPKADGYRGIHYVFKYKTEAGLYEVFNGRRIEIQIRTRLQHAWATAVETADTLTGQGLKFALNEDDKGDPRWKRFFALMGSAMARMEGRPIVPGTPEGWTELVDELSRLADEIKVIEILMALTTTVGFVGAEKGTLAVLLVLKLDERRMNVIRFDKSNISTIDERYLALEKLADPNVQVVQVAMDDMNALRQAYPNYYLDSRAFVAAFQETLSRRGSPP